MMYMLCTLSRVVFSSRLLNGVVFRVHSIQEDGHATARIRELNVFVTFVIFAVQSTRTVLVVVLAAKFTIG